MLPRGTAAEHPHVDCTTGVQSVRGFNTDPGQFPCPVGAQLAPQHGGERSWPPIRYLFGLAPASGFELLHVYADDASAVTVHRDYYTGDDNHFDLRYVLYVRMEQGRIAEVWEVPFDQAENDRYLAVQVGALARRAAAPS